MSLGWMANNWGKAAMLAARGGFGRTIQGAAIGAAAGAGWGMVSSDTSVIGGALMGAGLGAAGMRYGGAFYRKGMRGAMARGRGDFRRATGGLFSNSPAKSTVVTAQAAAAPRAGMPAMSSNKSRLRVPKGIRKLFRRPLYKVQSGTSKWKPPILGVTRSGTSSWTPPPRIDRNSWFFTGPGINYR
jgi:hypothetical protein